MPSIVVLALCTDIHIYIYIFFLLWGGGPPLVMNNDKIGAALHKHAGGTLNKQSSLLGLTCTVYQEILLLKDFLQLSVTAKITHTKICLTVKYRNSLPDRSKRFVVVLNTIPGNCCSKSRSGRSHLYRI